MSIFRTVRKIKDCGACNGTGRVYMTPSSGEERECEVCSGTGRVEVVVRASASSVERASAAIPQTLPPSQRKAAKARLREDDSVVDVKQGKAGKGYVDEDE